MLAAVRRVLAITAGVKLRPAVPADAEAVHALVSARDVADLGTTDSTLADITEEWAGVQLDLAADTLVADAGDTLAGYAVIRRPGTYAVVAPEHEGSGIGTELRRWAEAHDRRSRRLFHRQLVPRHNRSGAIHLRSAGYGVLRTYWRMTVELDGYAAAEPPPAGVALRPLNPATDGAELYDLDAVSFGENADYEPEPLGVFSAEHLSAHDLEPALSAIAVAGGRIVGFALTRRRRDTATGYIDLLAVHPDHRRRGIARALLTHTFAACAAAGLRSAALGVASDNPPAMALYEAVGMSPRFGFDAFERPVTERVRGGAGRAGRRVGAR